MFIVTVTSKGRIIWSVTVKNVLLACPKKIFLFEMGELHEKRYFRLQPVMLINEYNCLHFSEMDRLIKYKTDKTITLGEKLTLILL